MKAIFIKKTNIEVFKRGMIVEIQPVKNDVNNYFWNVKDTPYNFGRSMLATENIEEIKKAIQIQERGRKR